MALYKQTLEKFLRYLPISQAELVQLSDSPEPVAWQLILACIYREIMSTQLVSKQMSDLLLATPEEYSTTQIRQLVNYAVWKLDSVDIQLKQSSTFLKILSDWVNIFEQLISKPEAEDCCFGHLLEFISKNTSTYLERVVFIEEIFDDIRGVINLQHFWEVYGEVELDQLKTPVDNLNSLLGVLEIITFKSELVFKTQEGQETCLYNPLFHVLDSTQKYDQFVYRGICYILIHKGMLAKVEKNLTLVVLRFITWTKRDKWAIHLVKQMIQKTSSAVRFALHKEYQETFELLQHQRRFQLVESLETIPSFRELIKKRVEADSLETHQHQRNQVVVNRGQRKSFYFEVTKPNSILFLEYYVDIDINVSLSYLGTMWEHTQNIYLQENKSRGKSIQVLVNNCGLHSVTFDNNYSWLTSKNIVFSLNVFKPELIDNDPFNLLVYPWEFTRWQGSPYQLSQQEKEFLQVWKSNVCKKSDVLFRNGKVFFQGRLTTLGQFSMTNNQMMSIRSVLVVEPQLEYGECLNRIKTVNLGVKIRKCDQDDF